MSNAHPMRRAAVVMAVLVVAWGYAWVLAKMALTYCAPLEVATLRTAVGAAFLFPALIWRGGRLLPEHPWAVLGVGVFQTALFVMLNNLALAQGEAGKTSVLAFTMPFWVLVFAWPVLGERIRGIGWLAVALAGVGLATILEPWGLRATLLAKTLAVLSGMCWALGVVIAKRLQNRHRIDVYNFTFWQMALGLLPMTLVSVATHTQPIQWTWQFIVILLLLGILGTAVGWIAWFYVLKHLPAGTTSMASLGVPVVALLSSALQLGERPTAAEWTGMALIAIALALISWDTIRRHRAVDPLMGQE